MFTSENKSDRIRIWIKENLLKLEEYLYFLIALGLIIGFIIVMIDGLVVLFHLYESSDFSYGAIKFLDKILISLIFLEIFYTVTVAITEQSAVKCVEPFLLVAITALVRRLLILSFEISHPTVFIAERMKFYLYEMVIIGILVLLFLVGIILFRRGRR